MMPHLIQSLSLTIILDVHFTLSGSLELHERMIEITHASWTRHMLVVKLGH